MVSRTGYQLIDGYTFEYIGPEEYDGNEYFKYLFKDAGYYILAPTRNITKVNFPFDGYFFGQETVIVPLSQAGFDSLYGFTSVPENKILMKPRTDIGTNANGKDYVDLGLTSGTLWATMNVGATSETDYGSYFQWGDTVDKRDADCSWESYKYHDGSGYSKYNTGFNNTGGTIDNKITLDLEDDAARVNMRGDWKMPTSALMEELVEETTSERIKDYNGTNINGWRLTSKANGNSIFIPISGHRENSSNYGQGKEGGVWSSSLYAGVPYKAWELFLPREEDSDKISVVDSDNRWYGYAVRGIL